MASAIKEDLGRVLAEDAQVLDLVARMVSSSATGGMTSERLALVVVFWIAGAPRAVVSTRLRLPLAARRDLAEDGAGLEGLAGEHVMVSREILPLPSETTNSPAYRPS